LAPAAFCARDLTPYRLTFGQVSSAHFNYGMCFLQFLTMQPTYWNKFSLFAQMLQIFLSHQLAFGIADELREIIIFTGSE
jgi:hypothetical protein